MRTGLNIVIVNPIARTPALTPATMARPRVPSIVQNPQVLRETNTVELGAAMASRGHRTTLVIG
ncbi:MAG: hypothetical protein LN412_03820, partial [Candidatus Thermoplasmatota archaeon]|nr:hypothetical protein [Candidatus Thermoplasmatota archaeon]